MTEPRLTDSDLDYLAWLADRQGELHCACHFAMTHADGECNQLAAVTMEIHLAHVCKAKRLIDNGTVNPMGNVVAVLCRQCHEEALRYANAKLAQVKAIALQRSTTCQRCGSAPLIVQTTPGGPKQFMRFCPGCGMRRIHFDPVCGGGVLNDEGVSEGCGAKLVEVSDIIRATNWLNP